MLSVVFLCPIHEIWTRLLAASTSNKVRFVFISERERKEGETLEVSFRESGAHVSYQSSVLRVP